jgi:two-component sensor histidine kinase/ligand-binding sensor domain-containing protein
LFENLRKHLITPLGRICVTALLFLPFLMHASVKYNIQHRLLTQEDGLANRNVNTGLQDSRGFIWLGTKDGLNRYDGSRFLLFTKEKNNLQDNNVISLCEDANKKLWILYGLQGVNNTSGGKVDIFDTKSGQVITFDKYFKSLTPFTQKQIIGISVNKAYEMFIYCTDGFVYLYNGTFFKKLNTSTLKERGARFVFINYATDSGLWLRYDYFIKKNGGTINAPYSDDGYHVMCYDGNHQILMIYLDPKKTLDYSSAKFISVSSNGIKECDHDLTEETKKIFYRVCKRDYYVVLGDNISGNTLVYDSRECIYLYRNKELIPILDTFEARKIPSLTVAHVFSDNEGKLWACTSIGVMIFKIGPNRFTHYLNSTDITLSGKKPDYQVRGICADTLDNIYVSATTGAYHITEQQGKQNIKKLVDAPYTSPMISDGTKYYFGHRGLYEYDAVTHKKKILFTIGNDDIIWTAYKLGENRWWVSNRSDFYFVKNGIYHQIIDWRTGIALKDVWIHQFFKDKKGEMWAVGSKGLFLMKNDSVAEFHWAVDEIDTKYKLPFNDFHNVWEDENGDFWLASDGNGLYKWMRRENKFQHFTIADGLNSNLLYGILGDEENFLWISSDNGLMRFNKNDFSIKTYTTKDGITNNEFNRLSYFKAADGRMYFGTIDGVNAFYPHDFQNDNKLFTAPLQIIAFNQFIAKSNKLEDRTLSLLNKNKIILNPGDNFFTIEFALLDFETGKHRYAYKIEGIDKEWNFIDVNSMRISRPSYGKYLIRIKAGNNEGQWSSKEIKIPLLVIAPIYMHTWFIVTVVLLLFLLILAYNRFRLWKYQRQNQALEKVIENRTVELKTSLQQKEILLKEIHHRVKNNLQVISGLLQLQSWNINDENAKKALLEGHNRVLSIALIHQKLYQNEKLDTVEFGTFANELFSQVKGVFTEGTQKIKFNNQVHDLLINIDIAVPLGLILNELMTNSFKYAFKKTLLPEISICQKEEDGKLVLIYSDNGPGLPENLNLKESKSLGVRLIIGLAKQLHGTVDFFNENGIVAKLSLPRNLQ